MYQFNPEFVHVAAAIGGILLAIGCAWDWWDKRKHRKNLARKAGRRVAHMRHYEENRVEFPFDVDEHAWGSD